MRQLVSAVCFNIYLQNIQGRPEFIINNETVKFETPSKVIVRAKKGEFKHYYDYLLYVKYFLQQD